MQPFAITLILYNMCNTIAALRPFFTVLLLLLMYSGSLYAQCSFSGPSVIADLDTSSFSIIVDGAEANDLSDPSQGVCAVGIHMTHPVLADVVAELVSPSGQRLRLMGPTAVIPPGTSFITWDIQFNATNFGAFPDAGFDPVWDNLNLWLGFQTYVGTYLPHQGNLEDFDSGAVNGEWKLEFIDVGLFGEGELLEWEIFFCSTAGLECSSCEPGDPVITVEANEYCQGDDALISDTDITINNASTSPQFYDTAVAVFVADTLRAIGSQSELATLGSGTYTLCGASYLTSISEIISSLPSENVSYGELVLAAAQGDLCLSLSQQCVEVAIVEAPEVVTVGDTICRGSSVQIGGVSRTESGIYEVVTPTAGCDSISLIDLLVLEKPYDIMVSEMELSCDILTSELTLANLPSTVSVNWSTIDGFLLSAATEPSVTIGRPGTYIATVSTDRCQFVEDISITASDDYLFAIILADTLTCNNLEATATLDIEGTVDSVVWSSTNTFTEVGQNIVTNTPGLYKADIFGPTCETTRFVNIVQDVGISNITTMADTVSCDSTMATISVAVDDDGEYTYQWLQGATIVGTGSDYTTTEAGVYAAVITADNGCTDTAEVVIVNDNIELEVQLTTPVITCSEPTVTISYTANADADESTTTWTYPDSTNIIQESIQTSDPGDYMLNILTRGGCSFDTSFTIEADTASININVLNTTFPCGADSIRLNLTGVAPTDTVNWSGEGLVSLEADPWVYLQGTYFVSVVRANGCTAFDTVVVDADDDVPNVELLYGELNCTNSTVKITPADTINFTFEWELPDDMTETTNTITVADEGIYAVRVVDAVGGCSGRLSFSVERNEIDTLQSIMADTLTCTTASAVLSAVADPSIADFTWFDPSGGPLTDTNAEPTVNMPGIYSLDYTLSNGCVGSDTVEVVQIASAPLLETTNGNITCTNSSAELVATVEATDYTITWEAPNGDILTGEIITATMPGMYEVIIIAEGNCSDTVVAMVTADTMAISANLAADGAITCTDAIVEIDATYASEPMTVSWSGPAIESESQTVIAVSESGTYSVITTGANGCEATSSIEVVSEVIMPSVMSQTDTITCTNPIATLIVETASDTDAITWDDAELNGFTNGVTDAGTYNFVITNPEGCSSDGSLVVPVDTLKPAPETAVSGTLTCSVLEVQMAVTNPQAETAYEWDGPGINSQLTTALMTDSPGTYTVLASNPNGCFEVAEVVVDQDIRTPMIEALGDSITCNAGKSILNVDSDIPLISVEWTDGDLFFSTDSSSIIIDEGIYYVSVVGVNGCTASDSVEIIDVQVFPDVEVGDYYLPCDGAPAVVSPTTLSDGATMRWIGPGVFEEVDSLQTTVAGQYIGLAVSADQCVSTDTFLVIDEAIPPLFDFRVDTLYCKGPVPITAVDVEDDRSVDWVSPTGEELQGMEIEVDVPGIYNLIVTGTNGCKDSVQVELPDGRVDPIVTIDLLDPFECLNQAVRLSAEGSTTGDSYSYQWTSVDGDISSGETSQVLSVNGEGTYVLTIQESKTGCFTTDSIVLQQESQGFNDFTIDINRPTCQGFANASVQISEINSLYPPFQVYLGGNSYGQQQLVQYLDPGIYELLVVDALGCEVTRVVDIEEGDYPEVVFPPDTIIPLGETIDIQPLVFPDTVPLLVEWSAEPPCGPDCLEYTLTPDGDILLSLTVTDEAGCSATDDYLIRVSEAELVKFPNIFSPNGDNSNEIFFLPYTKGINTVSQLRIYNWNGTLIFSANDMQPGEVSQGWDGTFEGRPAMEGVYLLEAVLLLSNGETTRVLTDLTLVR